MILYHGHMYAMIVDGDEFVHPNVRKPVECTQDRTKVLEGGASIAPSQVHHRTAGTPTYSHS